MWTAWFTRPWLSPATPAAGTTSPLQREDSTPRDSTSRTSSRRCARTGASRFTAGRSAHGGVARAHRVRRARLQSRRSATAGTSWSWRNGMPRSMRSTSSRTDSRACQSGITAPSRAGDSRFGVAVDFQLHCPGHAHGRARLRHRPRAGADDAGRRHHHGAHLQRALARRPPAARRWPGPLARAGVRRVGDPCRALGAS